MLIDHQKGLMLDATTLPVGIVLTPTPLGITLKNYTVPYGGNI